MNPFSNNRPRLTASEGIRNKRDKTIYQAEKQRFQNHKTCGNKNVRYYDNGTIRSMQGYKLQQSLARGNVLCEDCNDRGMLCGKITNKVALGSIQMGNNVVSEYWGGGVLTYTPNPPTFDTVVPGWPVVVADISGVWGGSATDISKSLIGPDGVLDGSIIPMPYGYINNLIKIPRNLDGSGIVIDPSNILFPDELCDPFRYLQKSYLKTYLVIRGGIDIGNAMPGGVPGKQNIDEGVLGPEGCGVSWETFGLAGPLYQYVVGAQMFLSEDVSKNGIVNGTVKSLCCIREINMHINDNSTLTGTTYTKTVGIFDIYVELSYLNNMPFLSKLINYKPRYYPDNIPGGTGNNSGWDWLPLCSANSLSACSTNGAPFYFGLFNFLGNKGYFGARVAHTTYNYIESFKLIQGTIPPGLNQTKYNATKQSYMSCLEDGTRKINFTKNTVKQNNVNAAYCKYIVPPDSI